MTYTPQEIMTLCNISRGLLYQYRTGYYAKEPILIKDVDWQWKDGKIVYFESAIVKINNHKRT